jgi:hypothetical protein
MNDGERRYLVLNSKISKKGDIEYWKNVRKVLFNYEAGRIVAEYLLQRNIETFCLVSIPLSEYQQSVVESQTSTEASFCEQWDGEEIDCGEFFQKYTAYCSLNNLPGAPNMKALGIALLPCLRDGLLIKKRTNTGFFYSKETPP